MTYSNPEILWDMILSKKPDLIRKTWKALSREEQKSVLDHLIEMANRPGWMNQQQASAKVAVDVIAELKADEMNPKK